MATLKKAEVEVLGSGIVFTNEAGECGIDLANLSEEIKHQAMLHGLRQKISDSYSGVKTSHEVYEAFSGVIETLLAGQWNGGRSSTGGIWVEALARASGVEVAEAAVKWGEIGEDKQKELKAHPQVKQAKAEIELERAQVKAKGSVIDLDSLI